MSSVAHRRGCEADYRCRRQQVKCSFESRLEEHAPRLTQIVWLACETAGTRGQQSPPLYFLLQYQLLRESRHSVGYRSPHWARILSSVFMIESVSSSGMVSLSSLPAPRQRPTSSASCV